MKTIEVNTYHIINQSFLGRKLLFPLLIIGCFLFAKSTLAESAVEFEDVMPDQHIEAVLAGLVPTDLIVTHNGLEWVYASPCSGGCSQPDPSFQSTGGWRFATDAELANFLTGMTLPLTATKTLAAPLSADVQRLTSTPSSRTAICASIDEAL